MGFNSDPTRHAMPRGRVLFRRKSTAGVLGAFLNLGNCPKFDMTGMNDKTNDITDFTSPLLAPGIHIATERAPEFALSLYEENPDNIALAFMASPPTELTQAGTAITGETMPGGAKVGGIYQTALYGPVTLITIKKGATVFTLNTHYIVRDFNVGLVEIIALPSGVNEGDAITIDYTPTAYAAGSGFKRIQAATLSRIEGQLRYIGTGTTGPRHQVTLWNTSISLDGNFSFIGKDVVEFGLKVNVLVDPAHTELFEVIELSNGSGAPLS